MELLEYLEKYPLPDKEEDMTIEQTVIKDVIHDIKCDLEFNIHEFYFSLMHYCIYQEEKSYGELKRHITTMMSNVKIIHNILACYFPKNSAMNKYIDIESIDNEEFDSILDLDDFEDWSKMYKYKGFMFKPYFYLNIKSWLKEDAITNNAKRYFDMED